MPVAGPCHGGPHWLAALPQKMTHSTPWRVCPPLGWVGATSTRWSGSSPHYQTLHQSPHACQRCGLHQTVCFGLESGPDPCQHRKPPGHCSRPQHHPHEPPHTHLHRGILLCVGGFRFAAGFLAAISGLRLGRA